MKKTIITLAIIALTAIACNAQNRVLGGREGRFGGKFLLIENIETGKRTELRVSERTYQKYRQHEQQQIEQHREVLARINAKKQRALQDAPVRDMAATTSQPQNLKTL